MSIRYLADEDLDAAIIRGLRLREPAIDILDVKESSLRGTSDPELLDLAAEQGRVVISHDRNSMTGHFRARLSAGKTSPGIFIVSDRPEVIGVAIEYLLLVWGASHPDEWRDQITFVPSRLRPL